MNKIIKLVLIGSVGLTALFVFQKYRIPPRLQIFDLKMWHGNGEIFEPKQSETPLLLLSFFGTWCINCIDELPELMRIEDQYRQKVKLYLVTEETEEETMSFVNAHADLPAMLRSHHSFKTIGIHTYPTNYLIDKNSGEILFSKSGMLGNDAADLSKIINDYSSR